jgi:hypothetical protein
MRRGSAARIRTASAGLIRPAVGASFLSSCATRVCPFGSGATIGFGCADLAVVFAVDADAVMITLDLVTTIVLACAFATFSFGCAAASFVFGCLKASVFGCGPVTITLVLVITIIGLSFTSGRSGFSCPLPAELHSGKLAKVWQGVRAGILNPVLSILVTH